ncbi:MAG TPA: hypothetical protein VF741_10170 [Candidatus Aquilonibacter sp.]
MKILLLSITFGLAALLGAVSKQSVEIAQLKTCGEGSWKIEDMRNEASLFAGLADCTTVDSNGMLTSIVSGDHGFELTIQYQESSEMNCGPDERVAVTLAPGSSFVPSPGPYRAGYGNPAPPGSSCSFSIDSLPKHPAYANGGITAVLGRCSHLGGCAHPSDWDLISVTGSFQAYYRGP